MDNQYDFGFMGIGCVDDACSNETGGELYSKVKDGEPQNDQFVNKETINGVADVTNAKRCVTGEPCGCKCTYGKEKYICKYLCENNHDCLDKARVANEIKDGIKTPSQYNNDTISTYIHMFLPAIVWIIIKRMDAGSFNSFSQKFNKKY